VRKSFKALSCLFETKSFKPTWVGSTAGVLAS
jgi:hypothetical protein